MTLILLHLGNKLMNFLKITDKQQSDQIINSKIYNKMSKFICQNDLTHQVKIQNKVNSNEINNTSTFFTIFQFKTSLCHIEIIFILIPHLTDIFKTGEDIQFLIMKKVKSYKPSQMDKNKEKEKESKKNKEKEKTKEKEKEKEKKKEKLSKKQEKNIQKQEKNIQKQEQKIQKQEPQEIKKLPNYQQAKDQLQDIQKKQLKKFSNLLQNIQCPICYEVYNLQCSRFPVVLCNEYQSKSNAKHIICNSCWKNQQKSQCPLCRKQIYVSPVQYKQFNDWFNLSKKLNIRIYQINFDIIIKSLAPILQICQSYSSILTNINPANPEVKKVQQYYVNAINHLTKSCNQKQKENILLKEKIKSKTVQELLSLKKFDKLKNQMNEIKKKEEDLKQIIFNNYKNLRQRDFQY